MQQAILGWDVGGAHLKVALLSSAREIIWVAQYPCPLWQGVKHLQRAIANVRQVIPHFQQLCHVITMTGELVDVFPDRHQGVQALVKILTTGLAAPDIYFFAGTSHFVSPTQAVELTPQIASANWLASASYVASVADGLLIDMGSTTTDILILYQRQVAYRGYSDAERLLSGELVYSGMVRTALMGLASRVPFAGQWQPLTHEYFATTADIYRLLNLLPEAADQLPSADAQEKTLLGSARRLARMLGRDVGDASLSQWQQLAQYFADCQQRHIHDAIALQYSRGLLSPDAPFIGAGIGCELVKTWAQNLNKPYQNFGDFIQIRPEFAALGNNCAPAVAVTYLADSYLRA